MIITYFLAYSVPTAPSDTFVDATIPYPQNNPLVGNPYNLSCLYSVSKGFVAHEPTVVWSHPDQTNFTNSSIVFDALQATDSGTYTCEVMLISPVLKERKVAKKTYNLTIQRKPIISVIMLIQAIFFFSSFSKCFHKCSQHYSFCWIHY